MGIILFEWLRHFSIMPRMSFVEFGCILSMFVIKKLTFNAIVIKTMFYYRWVNKHTRFHRLTREVLLEMCLLERIKFTWNGLWAKLLPFIFIFQNSHFLLARCMLMSEMFFLNGFFPSNCICISRAGHFYFKHHYDFIITFQTQLLFIVISNNREIVRLNVNHDIHSEKFK